MKSKLVSIAKNLFSPIAHQYIFFVVFFCLMDYPNFVYLFSNNSFLGFLSSSCIPLFLSYIFSLIIHVSKFRVVKLLFYSITFLFFLFYLFLHNVFGLKISPQVLVAILETNKSETSEFFSTFAFNNDAILVYILISIFVILIIYVEKYKQKIKFWVTNIAVKKFIRYSLLCLVSASSIITLKTYINLFSVKTLNEISVWDFQKSNFQDPITRTTYSLFHIYYEGIGNKKVVELCRIASKENITSTNDSITLIVVIGESHIKHHSSLYGYYLSTQPFLEQEKQKGNLFVFNNVVATQNFTATSLRDIFCCNSLSDGEYYYNQPMFPAIFKNADYNVMFWDNQKEYIKNTGVSFSLNHFLYNKDVYNLLYNQTNKHSYHYDKGLVLNFKKHKHQLKDKNLVIFHLKGQHISAKKRFPRKFAKFTYKDIKRNEKYLNKDKLQKIADYDNATLYNDYILKTIIDLFKDENAVLVYLSDHGEEEFDYRDSEGRKAYTNDLYNYLKYQYEIPLYIWCSNKYKETNSAKIESLKQSLNKKMMSDNIYNTLFSLCDLKTKYYKPKRDVLNPKYNIKDRIVGYSINYDSIVVSHKEN